MAVGGVVAVAVGGTGVAVGGTGVAVSGACVGAGVVAGAQAVRRIKRMVIAYIGLNDRMIWECSYRSGL